MHGNAGHLAAPCDRDGGRMEQALGDYVVHLEALKKITRIADKCHRQEVFSLQIIPKLFLTKKKTGSAERNDSSAYGNAKPRNIVRLQSRMLLV
jgi:hypothetical protein